MTRSNYHITAPAKTMIFLYCAGPKKLPSKIKAKFRIRCFELAVKFGESHHFKSMEASSQLQLAANDL